MRFPGSFGVEEDRRWGLRCAAGAAALVDDCELDSGELEAGAASGVACSGVGGSGKGAPR